LAGSLNADPPDTATALLFGPEDSGLSRADLNLCDTVVNIPSDHAHPTLNLAQAVLIVSYELFLDQQRDNPQEVKIRTAREKLATAADLDRLLHHVAKLLAASGYPENPGTHAILGELRRLSARSSLSLKEIRTIRKICLRLIAALPKPESIRD
jgi:tRNA C32,U32 (ribose-2'-O)-methylase TrmJ